MPKINKKGQITIPADIRLSVKTFPGMKFEAYFSEGKIILTPYNYKCADCGEDIPEGRDSSYCLKCQMKRRVRVY